eukprot:Rhum_TRINITY_DN14083_c2_g2::Rhum_TRINITY_DN14083_c2_g2_i2::g.68514::m.68514
MLSLLRASAGGGDGSWRGGGVNKNYKWPSVLKRCAFLLDFLALGRRGNHVAGRVRKVSSDSHNILDALHEVEAALAAHRLRLLALTRRLQERLKRLAHVRDALTGSRLAAALLRSLRHLGRRGLGRRRRRLQGRQTVLLVRARLDSCLDRCRRLARVLEGCHNLRRAVVHRLRAVLLAVDCRLVDVEGRRAQVRRSVQNVHDALRLPRRVAAVRDGLRDGRHGALQRRCRAVHVLPAHDRHAGACLRHRRRLVGRCVQRRRNLTHALHALSLRAVLARLDHDLHQSASLGHVLHRLRNVFDALHVGAHRRRDAGQEHERTHFVC